MNESHLHLSQMHYFSDTHLSPNTSKSSISLLTQPLVTINEKNTCINTGKCLLLSNYDLCCVNYLFIDFDWFTPN